MPLHSPQHEVLPTAADVAVAVVTEAEAEAEGAKRYSDTGSDSGFGSGSGFRVDWAKMIDSKMSIEDYYSSPNSDAPGLLAVPVVVLASG